MTHTAADKLSKEKIQQLLAAVGVRSQEDTSADIEAVEYNWRQCQYFSLDQSKRLADFSDQVIRHCAEAFSRLYRCEFQVSVVSASQYFHKEIFNKETASDEYTIAFGMKANDSFGLITIPRSSAMAWTAQLLGGDESADHEERELSTLEESLLLDIASGLTKAFSDVYVGGKMISAVQVTRGGLPVQWQDDDELFRITFEAKQEGEGKAYQASFVVCCDQLDSVAGRSAADKNALSNAQIRKIMTEHIHDIPVSITAKLGTVMVDFGDIMALEVNDVLVLDKKVTDPVELLIEGKPFRSGRPVRSEGNYAVALM